MLKNMGEAVERVAEKVIGAAIEVHRNLGPGYLESVYEEALAIELELQGIPFRKQVVFALDYKGHPVGEGRMDFLIEGCLVVEIKAVDMLAVVHTIQVVSYLKATGRNLGLLINFNVPTLTAGLKRVIC